MLATFAADGQPDRWRVPSSLATLPAMQKITSLSFLALALALACGGDTKSATKTETKTVTKTETKTETEKKTDDAKTTAQAPKPDPERVLADSGLGVGGKFQAFDIVNCDTGDEYCQVCKFGGSPKIMAVGTIDDPEFKNDLKNLDALVQKYGEDKLKAFAVVTDIKDGKSTTPTADRDALIARAKALRSELGVKIPVVVPASKDGAPNADFDDYYNVTKSRTVMFADGKNSVKYSAIAPQDLAALNTAIESVVGAAAAPAPAPAG
jgi:hypothetical protein